MSGLDQHFEAERIKALKQLGYPVEEAQAAQDTAQAAAATDTARRRAEMQAKIIAANPLPVA